MIWLCRPCFWSSHGQEWCHALLFGCNRGFWHGLQRRQARWHHRCCHLLAMTSCRAESAMLLTIQGSNYSRPYHILTGSSCTTWNVNSLKSCESSPCKAQIQSIPHNPLLTGVYSDVRLYRTIMYKAFTFLCHMYISRVWIFFHMRLITVEVMVRWT